ncbi:DMT family transporter [Conexibacter sp. JD483]|uniref:DMT family transporter n=1 Tax=unclassified Conexibacter TaxID=2627773 RepID=UPI00271E04C9|nr:MULTISPECIES: DMT family transporter [unclassified Conexibacter]MDO8187670.1 DMT family transporter [Conexibacter sp. CPCC 205706]MDO8199855.1 DMT family transporter [Conexibacter sp. CPCC 205762]MDR9370232.1 DMT family transporter [Conexibacter sp. JD483]
MVSSQAQAPTPAASHGGPPWRPSRSVGIAFALVDVLFVGTSFIAFDAVGDYPTATGQAMRYALAAIVLFLALPVGARRWPARRDTVAIFVLSAAGVVGSNVLMIAAVREVGPAPVGMIAGCLPVVLALLAPLSERRRPSRRSLAAALLVSAGVAVVSGGGALSLLGAGAAIAAVLLQAGFMVAIGDVLGRLGAHRVAAWTCLAAAFVSGCAALLFDPAFGAPTRGEAAAIAYLGLFVTAAAFLCWSFAVLALGAERMGLFVGGVPMLALASGVALGDGPLTVSATVGCAAIVAGVVWGLGGGERKARARS